MFLKNKKLEINFTTNVPGLLEDPEVCPQPAKNFYPSWWNTMPHNVTFPSNNLLPDIGFTARSCPSFLNYFNQGYVIPAWCDMVFIYDKITNRYAWKTGRPGSPFTISTHSNDQFLNYAQYLFQGKNCTFIFKADSPWKITTSKGYSVLQLPLFYHFNDMWSVLPGILDSDVFHEINLQIAYFENKKEVFIKKGTPLAHYIVFKRNNFKTNIRNETFKDTYRFLSSFNRVSSKTKGGYFNLKRD